MSKAPRYTTFASGELETRLKEMAPNASFISIPRSEGQVRIGSGTLSKEHCFTVTLPDGTESPCRYDRLGSQYHRFSYAYHDGTSLPRQNLFERLANDAKSIEDKGQELAQACFRDAIEQERREYFARASEPSDGSRKRCPEKHGMSAKTAKKLGGYYALCHRTQKGLMPFGVAYSTLEKANAARLETDRLNVVVACCNRLDRCWEVPKFNPLMMPAIGATSPPSDRKEEGEDGPV